MATTKREVLEFNPINNIGLPDNMYMGKGTEIRHQKHFTVGNVRWCVFIATGCGWFMIKQEQESGDWYEIWTKQFDTYITLNDVLEFAKEDIKQETYKLLQAIVSIN